MHLAVGDRPTMHLKTILLETRPTGKHFCQNVRRLAQVPSLRDALNFVGFIYPS